MFVITNNVGMMIGAGVNSQNWLIKAYVIKGLFGILVIVCNCYKSCDFSEYLDYKNCKCKKSLVDKIVEECTENIEETRLVEITSSRNENKHKCTLCTVLFSIFFTINVGIDSYFLCFYRYLKKDVIGVNFGTRIQTTI